MTTDRRSTQPTVQYDKVCQKFDSWFVLPWIPLPVVQYSAECGVVTLLYSTVPGSLMITLRSHWNARAPSWEYTWVDVVKPWDVAGKPAAVQRHYSTVRTVRSVFRRYVALYWYVFSRMYVFYGMSFWKDQQAFCFICCINQCLLPSNYTILEYYTSILY
jgi:hypothetical protein